jgi:hypothetical protein
MPTSTEVWFVVLEQFAHLKDWDNVFPVVAEKETDSSNTGKHAEELWQQLDHLGYALHSLLKLRSTAKVENHCTRGVMDALTHSPSSLSLKYYTLVNKFLIKIGVSTEEFLSEARTSIYFCFLLFETNETTFVATMETKCFSSIWVVPQLEAIDWLKNKSSDC